MNTTYLFCSGICDIEFLFQGSFSDVTGRQKVLIATLILSSVSYISTGLTSSVIVILCLRASLGEITLLHKIIVKFMK